mgnify:CR=1 FL=1
MASRSSSSVFPLPPPLGPSLLVSAFTGNPFAADAVQVVYGVAGFLGNVSAAAGALATLSNNITWPNELTPITPAAGWGWMWCRPMCSGSAPCHWRR